MQPNTTSHFLMLMVPVAINFLLQSCPWITRCNLNSHSFSWPLTTNCCRAKKLAEHSPRILAWEKHFMIIISISARNLVKVRFTCKRKYQIKWWWGLNGATGHINPIEAFDNNEWSQSWLSGCCDSFFLSGRESNAYFPRLSHPRTCKEIRNVTDVGEMRKIGSLKYDLPTHTHT